LKYALLLCFRVSITIKIINIYNNMINNSITYKEDEYDREFIFLIVEIEKRYGPMTKHDRMRTQAWV